MQYMLEYPTIDTHNNRCIALYICTGKISLLRNLVSLADQKSETTFSFFCIGDFFLNIFNFTCFQNANKNILCLLGNFN